MNTCTLWCNTGVLRLQLPLSMNWCEMGWTDCLVHLTSPLDIFRPEGITGLVGEQNVVFESKHVDVHSETQCVWHSELSEHPVPRHTPIQVVVENIPCSATVRAWLISCSARQMSGLTSRLKSSRITLMWRNARWQSGETLTILAVQWEVEMGSVTNWKLSVKLVIRAEPWAHISCKFHAGVSSTFSYAWRIWTTTALSESMLHSLPCYVMAGWDCAELFT